MNSKRSSHRIRTMILQDLKRYWVISLSAFVCLFMASCVRVISNYSDLNDISGLIYSFNNMESFTYIWVAAVIPVAAALSCFHYLHRVNEVSAYHALPVTRKELFAGHALAGYLLCIIPVIANQFILFILARPVTAEMIDASGNMTTGNGFARSLIIYTTLAMMLIMLFVYAISILAGMLTGTVLMHTVGAVGLNILAPFILLITWFYCKQFLVGYDSGLLEVASSMSPVSGMYGISENDGILTRSLIYLAIAVIVLAFAYILYIRRKLENATEPLAYGFMIPIVAGLLTFFFGTLMGYVISVDNFIIGLAIGTVIMFLFSRMFVLKTTRIFNLRSLRSFICYAVILAVFVSILQFDVTGYEKNIPDPASVKSVSTDILEVDPGRFEEDSDSISEDVPTVFKDSKNIERITAIHQKMIKTADSGVDSLIDVDEYYTSSLSYVLDNGKVIKRKYEYDRAAFIDDENIAALYESDEFKKMSSVYNMKEFKEDDPYKKISITVTSGFSEEIISISKAKDRESFLAAMEKDLKERTYKQYSKDTYISSLGYIAIEGKSNTYERNLLRSDRHTLQWLKDHGHYDTFDTSNLEIKSFTVARYTDTNESDADLTSQFKGMKFNELLEKFPDQTGTEEVYNVEITLVDPDTKEESNFYISFSDDHVPDFIKNAKYTEFDY